MREKNFERNWDWGLKSRDDTRTQDRKLRNITREWSTAPALSAGAGSAAGALSLEGMLGPGLPYPKKLVIPVEVTVVDILATLSAHAGVTEPSQIAMKAGGKEEQKTCFQDGETGAVEHSVRVHE